MSGPRGKVLRYRDYAVDAERGVLTCRYELDGREQAPLHDLLGAVFRCVGQPRRRVGAVSGIGRRLELGRAVGTVGFERLQHVFLREPGLVRDLLRAR